MHVKLGVFKFSEIFAPYIIKMSLYKKSSLCCKMKWNFKKEIIIYDANKSLL